jgi:hypothetical protein
MLSFNGRAHLLEQVGIAEEHLVDLKDGCFSAATISHGLDGERVDLLLRLMERLLETADFLFRVLYFLALDDKFGNLITENWSDDKAG